MILDKDEHIIRKTKNHLPITHEFLASCGFLYDSDNYYAYSNRYSNRFMYAESAGKYLKRIANSPGYAFSKSLIERVVRLHFNQLPKALICSYRLDFLGIHQKNEDSDYLYLITQKDVRNFIKLIKTADQIEIARQKMCNIAKKLTREIN